MLFLHDGLHLRFLVIGQVELRSHEMQMAFHAHTPAHSVVVHGWRRGSFVGRLRLRECRTQQNGQGRDHQAESNRFHSDYSYLSGCPGSAYSDRNTVPGQKAVKSRSTGVKFCNEGTGSNGAEFGTRQGARQSADAGAMLRVRLTIL